MVWKVVALMDGVKGITSVGVVVDVSVAVGVIVIKLMCGTHPIRPSASCTSTHARPSNIR
jgi:hypothetical protein